CTTSSATTLPLTPVRVASPSSMIPRTLICSLFPYTTLFRSLQGVLLLSFGISHLEGGFTLRCLQRLSRPGLATLPCTWQCNRYRSEEHTSELQSRFDLVCRLLLDKKYTISLLRFKYILTNLI